MDPVIPTAAPAAPVAPVVNPTAPVAPVVPTVVAPAPVVAVGAPATTDVSLLDAAAPATPAAPVAPQTDAEKLTAAQALIEAHRLAADPNSKAAWNLDSTTPGTGEKPSWFKADKYKSVAAQAEAYTALEQRFGAFKGAPADGKYEWKPPENASEAVKGTTFDMENALFKGFNDWAKSNQLSQDGYNQVLGMLAQDKINQLPNPAKNKEAIGANADARITAVSQWAKANLEAPEQAALWDATRGKNAPIVFKTIEALIAKTSQARMPKPGDDVPVAGAGGLAAINDMQAAKNDKGQRLVDVDPAYRQKVFAARAEYFKANPVERDRQGQIRG